MAVVGSVADKQTKRYVRTYDVGRVIAWLQDHDSTVSQISEICGIKVPYLRTMLRAYRQGDTHARTSEDIARRLFAMCDRPLRRPDTAYATDAEMSEFRRTLKGFLDKGATFAYLSEMTGLDRATLRRGLNERLIYGSVRKLLSAKHDIIVDMRYGFGCSRMFSADAIAARAAACRRTAYKRHEQDAKKIRAWLAENPGASRTACANAFGWSVRRVSNVDDEFHLFDERSKRHYVNERTICQYVDAKVANPTRPDRDIASDLCFGPKTVTKIRRRLRECLEDESLPSDDIIVVKARQLRSVVDF